MSSEQVILQRWVQPMSERQGHFQDRVLYWAKNPHYVACSQYGSIDEITQSDHRPVFGSFQVLVINKPIPQRFFSLPRRRTATISWINLYGLASRSNGFLALIISFAVFWAEFNTIENVRNSKKPQINDRKIYAMKTKQKFFMCCTMYTLDCKAVFFLLTKF